MIDWIFKEKKILCFWNVISMHLCTVSVVPSDVMIFVADRLMIFYGILDFFFQLSPVASTITTENIVFTVWRSTYDCSCFWHRIAVTSCHLPVLYSGHPLDVMYFLILLLQRSSQLNLSKQYQPPRNNICYFVVIQNVAKIQRLQQWEIQ